MTISVREQTKNATETTLNGSHNDSTTSIAVTDGSVFPSTGNFRVLVETEIMKVTARSSNTLTVVRGQEGTTAASHANLVKIIQVESQEGFDALGKDQVGLWGWSSLLPLHKLVADDGVTLLTTSDFTWQNQGGATVTDEDGTIILETPTSSTSDSLRIQERSISGSVAYIAAFEFALASGGSPGHSDMFMGFRESSSSKLTVLHLQTSQGGGTAGATVSRHARFSVFNWTNSTTINATVPLAERLVSFICPVVWLKVEDDSTNLKFYLGMDGVEWILVHTVSRTAHMAGGPDRVVWGANCPNNESLYGSLVRLLHWSKSGSAPLKEQTKSLSHDQLNGSIDNSQTTLTVDTGSAFPSTGNFRLICDSEIMICTARSSNTLTVVRGQEGTSGASHADNALIYHIATEGAIKRMGQDYVPHWGVLNRAHKIVNDAGTGLLTVSDFTWDNQGSATATDENGTVGLYCPPASGVNWRVLFKSAPSTPYSYIGAFEFPAYTHDGGNGIRVVMGHRKNSSGQLHCLDFIVADSGESFIQVSILNTSTSFFTTQKSGNHSWIQSSGLIWFKIEDNGTNLKYYIGLPGSTMHWLKMADFGRTSYMTGGPDQVFFGLGNGSNNTNGFQARLVHWSKE